MLDGTFGTIKSEMGCHGETHSLNTMPILGLDNTLILDISSTWNNDGDKFQSGRQAINLTLCFIQLKENLLLLFSIMH